MIYTILVLLGLLVIAVGVIVYLMKVPGGKDIGSLIEKNRKLESDMILIKKESDEKIEAERLKRTFAEKAVKDMEGEIEDTLSKVDDIANGAVDMSGLK